MDLSASTSGGTTSRVGKRKAPSTDAGTRRAFGRKRSLTNCSTRQASKKQLAEEHGLVSRDILIAVWLEKGGVSKSSTTLELAHAFIKLGKRVAIWDIDSQGSLSQVVFNVEDDDDWDGPDTAESDEDSNTVSDEHRHIAANMKRVKALKIPCGIETPRSRDTLDPLKPGDYEFSLNVDALDKEGKFVIKADGTRHQLSDKLVGNMFQNFVLSKDCEAVQAAMKPQEWEGLAVNSTHMYRKFETGRDYPEGELMVFPGASQSTVKLVKNCADIDSIPTGVAVDSRSQIVQDIGVAHKKQTISRLRDFLKTMSWKNEIDVHLFDLNPTTNALNKLLITHIVDFIITPAQADISSSFALNTELKKHLPEWFREVDALKVPTRFSDDYETAGQRNRVGLPKILPIIISDFDHDNGYVLSAQANHIESQDMLLTNTWIPKDYEGKIEDLPQEKQNEINDAALLHSLHLPDGNGKSMLALWPRVRSLGQAHEMGRALSAIDQACYEEFFKRSDRGLPWAEVRAEQEMVIERFRAYAEIVLAYGDHLHKGKALNNLTAPASNRVVNTRGH